VGFLAALAFFTLFLGVFQVTPASVNAATVSDPAPSGALSVTDYGAKGDGAANDTAAIQACLDAAASQGKTCYLPAGTYRVYTLRPPSGVTVQGAGAGQTVIRTLAAKGAATDAFDLVNRSNVTVQDLSLLGASTDGHMYGSDQGFYMANSHNITIKNVWFNYWTFAMRTGSDGATRGSSNISVIGCRLLGGSLTGFLGAYTSGLTIADCDFDSATVNTRNDPGGPSHHLYFLVSVSNVVVRDTTFRNGDSWSVQIYPDGGLRDMTFSNVTWSNVYAGIYVGPGTSITFDGVKASSTRYAGDGTPWFNLTGSNITVQNFNVSGAGTLVSASGSAIVFRNGTYTGAGLGTGAVFEGVTAGSSAPATTTTLPATTTTTVSVATTIQPTTTTIQPTTTTTAPVTTTTLPATTTTVPVTTTTERATTITVPATTTTSPVTKTTQPVTTTTEQVTTTTQPVVTTLERVTTTLEPVTTTSTVPATPMIPQTPAPSSLEAVTITSPEDLSVVQGRVDIRVSLSSPFATSRVRLHVDGRLIGQDFRAPYSFTWRTDRAVLGHTYTILATAYDRLGRELGSATCRVTVASSTEAVKAALVPPVDNDPTDTEPSGESPYEEAVSELVEAGVMSGFVDGRLCTAQPATRAQFAKMLSLTLGIADDDTIVMPFKDLDPIDEHLYPHKYVAALYSLGAIAGTSADEFSPWAPVTRAQMVTMLVRALRAIAPEILATPSQDVLPMTGAISPDHTASMAAAEASGLLQGIVDYGNTWDPWAPASRGELAQILTNVRRLDG
jgi:hypothetical protein